MNLTVLTGDILPLPRNPSLLLHSPVLVALKVLQPRVICWVVWGWGGGSTQKYFKVPVSSIPSYMLTVWWARKEAEMDLIWFITWLSLGRDRGGTRIKWITNAWLRYSWLVLMLMISQRSCAKHRIAIFTQDYQSKTVSLKWTYFCLQMHSLNVLNAVNVLREAEFASCG